MKSKMKKTGFALSGVALLALAVAVVMWLWNALIPDIFGFTTITYWQALGLVVLFRLLFGHLGHHGFRCHKHHHGHHRNMHEMMHGMSHNEKREFIRRRMHAFCENTPVTDECAADERAAE